MEIGYILRSKRKELKLTQKQVAEYCGVTEATISRWESGNISNMRRDKIYKLATILQLSPAEIMGFTEQEMRAFETGDLLAFASNDPDAITLLAEYQKMTKTDRKRMIEFAKALNLTH